MKKLHALVLGAIVLLTKIETLLKLESFNSSLTSSWPVAPNTKACSFFIIYVSVNNLQNYKKTIIKKSIDFHTVALV